MKEGGFGDGFDMRLERQDRVGYRMTPRLLTLEDGQMEHPSRRRSPTFRSSVFRVATMSSVLLLLSLSRLVDIQTLKSSSPMTKSHNIQINHLNLGTNL